jgi:hypothetical protein
VILDLLYLGALATWSAFVGRLLLRRLAPHVDASADALALALPLGLGVLALGVLFLGWVRVLSPVALVLLLLCPIVAGFARFHLFARQAFARGRAFAAGLEHRNFNTSMWAFASLAAIVLGATLVMALTPVTDGDALCYHLQVPKVFLRSHGLVYDPDLHETIYPLLTELLFGVALALRGPVACRLVSWLLGVALALIVTALARPILGRGARWAGLAALLVPAISNGMSAPLNDVALASFCNAGLLALVHWIARPTPGAVVLCATLAGMAVGVKYPAMVWVALLGVVVLLQSLRGASALMAGGGRWWVQPLLFGVVVLLVGGPWYLRAYRATGNPVFPFYKQVFGGAGLDEVLEPAKRPLEVTTLNLATALGPMSLDPDRFDSVSHQLGPLFLMAVPALFLWRAPGRLLALAGFAWVFFTLCLTQRQSMRFLLAAVGPWSIAVVWVWQRAARSRTFRARACTVIMSLVFVFEAGIPCARLRRVASVVTGEEQADRFLARCEPTFLLGRWIAENLPDDAHVIGQDHRGYYIPRPYTMELAHRRRTGLGARGESPVAIVETLRARGFTHLLLCPPVPEDAVEFDATLGRLLEPWIRSQRPVFRAELADGNGVARRYSLYRLESSAASTAQAGSGGEPTS